MNTTKETITSLYKHISILELRLSNQSDSIISLFKENDRLRNKLKSKNKKIKKLFRGLL